eukprot:TRINITY_DN4891_c0_g1_i1.p1 TRINITY_DN4891_c0_g1~~TRINITY_DN4891_c0_g1_i1.p1  ORF type:complete len:454 (-),score=100.73 TRINITY_DN4891_c0_g1_i1:8-1369(-)
MEAEDAIQQQQKEIEAGLNEEIMKSVSKSLLRQFVSSKPLSFKSFIRERLASTPSNSETNHRRKFPSFYKPNPTSMQEETLEVLRWWYWRPTSASHQRHAERTLLQKLRTPYTLRNVKVSTGSKNEPEEHIHTLILGKGPPLVLFHGFGSGIGLWIANLDYLASNHTIYAIDLPGFAASSRTNFNPTSISDAESYFTSRIERWRQNIGLDRFHLLGHSFGGYLSSLYALRYPDHLSSLILADPWGLPHRDPDLAPNPNQKFYQKWLRDTIAYFPPLSSLRFIGPFGPRAISSFRNDLVYKFRKIFPEWHEEEKRNKGKGIKEMHPIINYLYHSNVATPATGERAFHKLVKDMGWARAPLVDRLPELRMDVRVTMVYGKESWMSSEAGWEVKRRMEEKGKTNVRLVEMERCGHHVYIDNADEFNRIVGEAMEEKERDEEVVERKPKSKQLRKVW